MNPISSSQSTSPNASQITLKLHEEGSKVEEAAHSPDENLPVISRSTGEQPPQVEGDQTLTDIENVWIEAANSEEDQQGQKAVHSPNVDASDFLRKVENSVQADASLAVSHQKDPSKVAVPTSEESQGNVQERPEDLGGMVSGGTVKAKVSPRISDGVWASLFVTCWAAISAVTVASFYLSHAAAWPMFGVTAALTLIFLGVSVVKCRGQKSQAQTIDVQTIDVQTIG